MRFTMIWLNSMTEMEKLEISKITLLSLLDLPSIIFDHAKIPTTGGAESVDLPENGTSNLPLPAHSFKIK